MDVGERYVLGRLVGEGATAFVYEAQDTVLRRQVAVKVFRDADLEPEPGGQPGTDPDAKPRGGPADRVSEEVRILTSLVHSHLLPLYDTGCDGEGHRFLVMPLVRGTTLARLVSAGPVAPREVKRIGTALADALSHIHAHGIVHRDVKPSNVLLDGDGTPYLADFGFAHADDSPALTATNCVVGTAGYLAPEQAEGLSVTPAADVYALGLVLLEALTGERAYRGTPLERAVANALRPPAIPARLGQGWLELLRALTAKEPSERPTAEQARVLMAGVEDEFPEVTALDATMELAPVLAQAPDHPIPVLTIAGDADADTAADAASSAREAPDRTTPDHATPAAAVLSRATSRRLAAVGTVALAATAFLGFGAGTTWLSSGAADPPRQPAPTTPGAGAGAAGRQTPAPAPAPAATRPAASPPPVVPASASDPQVLSGSADCRKGHGKHKCQNGDNKGSQ
ncbi:MAG: serine/threonine protein kinase [Catenulispora sp.]|nr:serine/threonine protein kinase [Catenulispora sp.]